MTISICRVCRKYADSSCGSCEKKTDDIINIANDKGIKFIQSGRKYRGKQGYIFIDQFNERINILASNWDNAWHRLVDYMFFFGY